MGPTCDMGSINSGKGSGGRQVSERPLSDDCGGILKNKISVQQ